MLHERLTSHFAACKHLTSSHRRLWEAQGFSQVHKASCPKPWPPKVQFIVVAHDSTAHWQPVLYNNLSLRLQDIALSLLFAGWETSAASMCMLFKQLQEHPEVLQAMRDEQRNVCLHT